MLSQSDPLMPEIIWLLYFKLQGFFHSTQNEIEGLWSPSPHRALPLPRPKDSSLGPFPQVTLVSLLSLELPIQDSQDFALVPSLLETLLTQRATWPTFSLPSGLFDPKGLGSLRKNSTPMLPALSPSTLLYFFHYTCHVTSLFLFLPLPTRMRIRQG